MAISNSNHTNTIENEYMIKSLLNCLEQEMLTWNRLRTSSRSLSEYLMERSGTHNSKHLVSWGGSPGYYSHTYVVERRPYIYNYMHWARECCGNILDTLAGRFEFTIATGAFEWSAEKCMFYVRLNWNKQFDKHCDVIRKTTQLNQEIFRRSHLIKNGDLETYLYVELFDDFNFDTAVSIIREAHSILESEALAIAGE